MVLFMVVWCNAVLYTSSLKKNGQFRAVYNRGKSLADKSLVVYALKNKLDINRLGMSVSKKVGNSVQRNHIRRLIREAYRTLEKEGVRTGLDLVVIARAPAVALDYHKTLASLATLLRRHGATLDVANGTTQ